MSVVLQSTGIGTLAYPFYTGESTDVKPIPTTEDATFYELDTRRRFVWKNREWRFSDAPADISAAFSASLEPLLKELRTIRRGLELVLNHEIPDGD